MELVVLSLVFFGTLLLVGGVYILANRRQLEAAEVARARLKSPTRTVDTVSILRDDRPSNVALLNRLLAGKAITDSLRLQLERAGAKQSVGEFLLIVGIVGSVAFAFGNRLGLLLGLLCAVVGGAVPIVLLKRKQHARLVLAEAQLPEAIDMLVNALRAGYSLHAAIEFVGKETPEPLGPEFARAYDEQRLGVDARAALLRLQERIGTVDVKMFVTALLIQRETGGNLAEVLGNLSTLMRERVSFRGHVQTLVAEPKMSAIILAMLPVCVFVLLVFMNKKFMEPMWTTPIGRLLLAYAACSVLAGYFVMTKMADIKM